MKANARINVPIPNKRQAEIIYKALEPEIEKTTFGRSKASLDRKEALLVLRIKAKDTVALRASVNTYLRWTNSMINVLQKLEKLF